MSVDRPSFSVSRSVVLASLVLSFAAGLSGASHAGASVPLASGPLRFEPNLGQTDPQVRFLSGARGGDVFLTPSGMVLRVHEAHGGEGAVIRLQILGANPNPRVVGLDPLPGRTNYFIGNDPKKWRTNVPSFAKVKYADVYPGIDLICYGNEGNLEYDIQVAPGADPRQIAMSVEGADGVAIDGSGDLVLRTAVGEIRQYAPRIYQRDGAGRREIAGGYVMRRDGRVAFQLASYDSEKPLVIDPQLVYATYFGGTAETDIKAIAVDAAGFVYVAGDTYAHDFPTKNPEQPSNLHSQSLSAIVSKLTPDGASLVYSTYLGGSDTFAIDVAVGIAVDSTGAAYVAGTAGSSDFPTKNSILGKGNGIFVTKLSADGSSLVYSSVYGGSGFDNPRGIILDSSNDAYIFGDTESTDFPTVNPTQAAPGGGGFHDGFWSVISPDGSQLLFSTYVGGNNDDDVRQLHVFPQTGDVWISGITQSSDIAGNDPANRLPYQGYFTRAQSANASRTLGEEGGTVDELHWTQRVLKSYFDNIELLNRSGSFDALFYGIYYYPPGSLGKHPAAATSSDFEVLVSGGCAALPPATSCSGAAAVLTEDLTTLTIKSAINLPDTIPPLTAATQDSRGAIYVTGVAGRTSSPPLVDPIQAAKGGGDDALVIVFAPVTREITFSTYLGGDDDDEPNGIALDPQGNIYVAGQTQSSNFPTKNAFQPTAPAPNGASIGDGNSFIAKISTGAIQPVARGHVDLAKPRGDSTRALPPRPGD